MKYQVIRDRAKIGKHCDIRNFVFIDKDVEIGNNCKIMDGARIYRGVKILSHVFIGPNVVFVNDKEPDWSKRRDIKEKWVVGHYASIGAGAIILPNINIGDEALVGAGSVVTHDVLGNTIVAGNPAKFIRYRRENDLY